MSSGVLVLAVLLVATCSNDENGPTEDAGIPDSGAQEDGGGLDAGPDAGAGDAGHGDGGPGDGGIASACSGLLGARGDAGVFTPPLEVFHEAQVFSTTCRSAASDRRGSLAFLVQQGGTDGRDGPGDAFEFVLDPVRSDVVSTRVDGGRGLWDVSTAGADQGFVVLLTVLDPGRLATTWFDHQGHQTAVLERTRAAPQTLLDDGHGGVVAAFGLYDDESNLRVEAYDPDGGIRWSDSFPTEFHVLEIDWEGRTLLKLSPEVDGGTRFVWIDQAGDAGTPFAAAIGNLLVPRLVPRLEGGFFLGVEMPGSPHQWIGQFGSGATRVEPVPGWLDEVDPLLLRPSPTGNSYVVLSLTARGVDGFEVRSPDGDHCGRVELPIPPEPGNALDVFLGRDGTVLRTFQGGCLPDAGRPLCPCGWEYWPGLLR
jgi:hypothetical protein